MSLGTGLPGIDPEGVVADGPSAEGAGAGERALGAGITNISQNIGAALQAHADTVDAGQVASLKSTADSDLATLHAANLNDPAAFQQAAAQYKSQVLSSVPGRYAMQVGAYIDQNAAATYGNLVVQGAVRQHAASITDLGARETQVGQKLTDAYSSGQPLASVASDPVVASAQAEFQDNIAQQQAAGALTPAQAQAKLDDQAAAMKAAAFSTHLLQMKQSQGASAAVGELTRLEGNGVPDASGNLPTPADGSFESGVTLSPTERALMVAKGRAALTSSISDDATQVNLAKAAQTAASAAMDKRVSEDVAQTELNGKSDGSLTEAQVAAVKGQAGVVQWLHDKTDALDRFNQYGALGNMTPAQAAEHRSNVNDLKDLPKTIDSPEGFEGQWQAIKSVEHGSGGAISPAGAMGTSQLMDGTARQVAAQMGMHDVAGLSPTALRARLTNDQDPLSEQLGRRYYQDLLSRYNGDPFLAATAYHAGPGNVDNWVGKFGNPASGEVSQADFLNHVRQAGFPSSADYPVLVANASKGGKAAADYARLDPNGPVATAARSDNINDPVGFAAKQGFQAPAPINPTGFAGSPSDQAAFSQALQQRQAQATTRSGQNPWLPTRLFSNAEATAFAQQADANPRAAVAFGAAVRSALGPTAAASALSEIGVKAPQASAGLALAALPPTSGNFVRSALAGMDAKAQGAKEPVIPKGQNFDVAQAKVAPAFAYMGAGALPAARQNAESAHLYDTQRGQAQPTDAYMQAAAGGTQQGGRWFGGVAPVNGAQTVLPAWVPQDSATTVLKAAGSHLVATGQGPVASNGAPVSANEMARMQMLRGPDGTYLVRAPGSSAILNGRDGKPFILNLEQARPYIAQTAPTAVMPGTR